MCNDVVFCSAELTKAHECNSVTEDHDYEVIKGGVWKAKEEFALKKFPSFFDVAAPGGVARGVAPGGMPMVALGGGAGEEVPNNAYESLS